METNERLVFVKLGLVTYALQFLPEENKIAIHSSARPNDPPSLCSREDLEYWNSLLWGYGKPIFERALRMFPKKEGCDAGQVNDCAGGVRTAIDYASLLTDK